MNSKFAKIMEQIVKEECDRDIIMAMIKTLTPEKVAADILSVQPMFGSKTT